MPGGLAIRKSRSQSLLMIFVVGLMIAEQGCIIDLGRSSCCSSSCPRERMEQSLWNKEAYEFLYCDDCFPTLSPINSSISSSNQPINGTANYWLNKGNSSYLAGFYEQAEESYAAALKLNPSLVEGWLNRGNALFFLGRYQESLDAYNAALRLAPQSKNALLGKSHALLALNRTDESNSNLEAAKIMGPQGYGA